MGKKIKNKAKSGIKMKQISDNSVVLGKDKKVCTHFETAVDVEKVSSKLESAESTGCEDCREDIISRKGGKRKGGSKATWVCLHCGYFSCGGAGLPNSHKTHAIRHASQSRHPLVIQLENTNRRWCFSCSTLIPVDKVDDNGEQNDVLSGIVELLKKQSSNANSEGLEDLWLGNGSITSNARSGNNRITSPNGMDFYAVRGLANLGNTCFFNSVMQNLLAIDVLRDYLLTFNGSMGPLTCALKKIFVETVHELGPRHVINPQPLFGCISTKASQFRGYEQQDSHELLRCLLDQLSTEDLRGKRSLKSSQENGASLPARPTFIDTIFGGKISSTVCCVECRHTSVVHESFLDLSLPLPSKKPPPKKVHPSCRAKKTKPPPQKVSKQRQKLNKYGDSRLTVSNDKGSRSQDYCTTTQPVNASTEVTKSGDLEDRVARLDYLETVIKSDNQETNSWLDNLEQVSVSNDQNLTAKSEYVVVGLESRRNDVNDHIGSFQAAVDISDELGVDTGDKNGRPQSIVGDEKRDTEMSLSIVGDEENTLYISCLSELFDEPEVAETPPILSKNIEESAHLGNDFQAANNAKSDLDEADDINLSVSVESCLAHFVKAELLSGEHAWHCENCSKLQQEERRKLSKDESSSSEVLQLRNHPSSDSFNSAFVAVSNEFGLTLSKGQRERDGLKIACSDATSVSVCPELRDEASSRSKSVDCWEHKSGEDEESNSNIVKAMRDATKRMLIDKSPTILTIHLKRFAQDRRGRLSKLKGHVVFNEFLNLRPYLDNRSIVRDDCNYRLVGVVVHSGSMTGGHYVAFVRGGDKHKWRSEEDNHRPRNNVWYYASDAYVRETTLEDVLRSEAYILFYEKVQP